MFRFWSICRFEGQLFPILRYWFTKPAYTQKNQHFDAKSAKNLHILKNIKSFDSEKSPNLHILKKIKKIKNLRLYVGLAGIDDLVFDFFDFFEYMQVW